MKEQERIQDQNMLKHARQMSITLLAGFAASAAPNSFAQSSATISLNGGISPGTCTVNNVSKTMPHVSADKMPGANSGVVDSYTPFTVQMRNCAGVMSAKLTFGSVADAHPDQDDTFVNKGSGPSNISIWIQRQEFCSTSSNGATPGVTHTVNVNNSPSLDYKLCAQYWRNGSEPVSSGAVSTTFTLNVAYE